MVRSGIEKDSRAPIGVTSGTRSLSAYGHNTGASGDRHVLYTTRCRPEQEISGQKRPRRIQLARLTLNSSYSSCSGSPQHSSNTLTSGHMWRQSGLKQRHPELRSHSPPATQSSLAPQPTAADAAHRSPRTALTARAAAAAPQPAPHATTARAR